MLICDFFSYNSYYLIDLEVFVIIFKEKFINVDYTALFDYSRGSGNVMMVRSGMPFTSVDPGLNPASDSSLLACKQISREGLLTSQKIFLAFSSKKLATIMRTSFFWGKKAMGKK